VVRAAVLVAVVALLLLALVWGSSVS